MKRYPLAHPTLGLEEERAVLKVLRSGVLSIGPYVEQFERAFAKRVGTRYAVAVSSGTAGLHLAMIAAGIKADDEVITSPFSFVASANSILYVGAKPVFVDIDPVTYNLDPVKIEAAITKKTKAILVVHIFGQPCEMKLILRLAKKHKLKIIEDACESLGATYRGKPVGTFGESAVFAFYPNKQMTTGEGGMIVTNKKPIYDLCKSLANQGRGSNLNWLDHKYLGYNYRLDEMSAAVGLVQVNKLDQLIAARRRVVGWYEECLRPFQHWLVLPVTASGNTHTWFVYVVQIRYKTVNRDLIIKSLAKAGVASKSYLPSIHLFGFYKNTFGYRTGDYPISESVSNSSLALPFYADLTKKDVVEIASRLIKVLKHAKID